MQRGHVFVDLRQALVEEELVASSQPGRDQRRVHAEKGQGRRPVARGDRHEQPCQVAHALPITTI